MKTIKKMANIFMTTNIFKLYPIMLGIHFTWIITIGITFILCGFEFSQHVADISKFKNSLFLVPITALMEEIFFRWIPMIITVAIITKVVSKSKSREYLEQIKKKWMMVILVIISIIFGYVHGNIFNVFLQGVSGLIFSAFYFRAYFRSNPYKGITRWQLIPLASATLFHCISNTIMIF